MEQNKIFPLMTIGPFKVTYPHFQSSSENKNINEERTIHFKKSHPISKGDLCLISGVSGAGKSTLFYLLKGLIPEYIKAKVEGNLSFENQNLISGDLSSQKKNEIFKRIIYVFQNPYSQIICSSVKEDFFFTMENLKFSKLQMDQSLLSVPSFFNIHHLFSKKTSILSGGECQKLVLASALAAKPEILLLDEPTAFMDKEARLEFYQFLNSLKKKYTILLIDHHLDEVLPYVSGHLNFDISLFEEESILQNNRREKFITFSPLKSQNSFELKASNLFFKYKEDESWRLQNLNFKMTSGEIIIIQGKNGVGKTTLFKLLCGILKPDKGDVFLTSFDKKTNIPNIIQSEDWSNHITYLMQNPESHFLFDTIFEELDFNYQKTFQKKLTKEKALEFIHSFLGNEISLDISPFLLSEGEKRRLTFLMSLLEGKEIFLYDEPTFGQDKASKKIIVDLILEMRKFQKIQMIITHDDSLWPILLTEESDQRFILEDQKLIKIE